MYSLPELRDMAKGLNIPLSTNGKRKSQKDLYKDIAKSVTVAPSFPFLTETPRVGDVPKKNKGKDQERPKAAMPDVPKKNKVKEAKKLKTVNKMTQTPAAKEKTTLNKSTKSMNFLDIDFGDSADDSDYLPTDEEFESPSDNEHME